LQAHLWIDHELDGLAPGFALAGASRCGAGTVETRWIHFPDFVRQTLEENRDDKNGDNIATFDQSG